MNKVKVCKPNPKICELCQKPIGRKNDFTLELNSHKGSWHDPALEVVPEEQSQGCFSFHHSCATILLNKKPARRIEKKTKRLAVLVDADLMDQANLLRDITWVDMIENAFREIIAKGANAKRT